jgi:quinoprotein glucose dehydrogenase
MRTFVLLLAGSLAGFPQADWPAYHGSPAQTHYSTLDQINTANVGKLREVWRYESGD